MGYRKPVGICGPYTIVKDLNTKMFHILNLNGEDIWRKPFRYKDYAIAAALSVVKGEDTDDARNGPNSFRHLVVRISDGKIFRGCAEAADVMGISSKTLRGALNTRGRYCVGSEILEYAD